MYTCYEITAAESYVSFIYMYKKSCIFQNKSEVNIMLREALSFISGCIYSFSYVYTRPTTNFTCFAMENACNAKNDFFGVFCKSAE
jgi:hypothetical protein